MELHLCGSRKYDGNEETYWKSVRDFIVTKNITQVLFLGTAAETHPGPLALQFFKEKISLPENVQVFDAEEKLEFSNIDSPAVYVLGGKRQIELLHFIHSHPEIEDLIRTCPYYFGESMGAKLVGSKLRIGEEGSPLVPGLRILKSTIIEGHYTQKNRQQALKDEVLNGNLLYGLGIDEDAEVVTTPETFPSLQKFGPGLIEVISRQSLQIKNL